MASLFPRTSLPWNVNLDGLPCVILNSKAGWHLNHFVMFALISLQLWLDRKLHIHKPGSLMNQLEVNKNVSDIRRNIDQQTGMVHTCQLQESSLALSMVSQANYM